MRGLKPELGKDFTTMKPSHLLQMRGLKQEHSLTLIRFKFVASFTDAWIETKKEGEVASLNIVASFTDAWIETFVATFQKSDVESHLLQMRGLKPPADVAGPIMATSHLLQMRGLKPSCAF